MRPGEATACWKFAALCALAAAGPARADDKTGYDCTIEPNQVIELRSAVEGVIDKVLVRRGDRIKAGQPLVMLESSVEQSALEVAQARANLQGHLATVRNRLDYATRKLARVQELHDQNYAAGQQRDEAEAEKRIADSDLREALENQELAKRERQHAESQLGRRTLRSPFNGIVLDRQLNPGDVVEGGAGRRPILKLAQIEPLRVEVVLPMAAWGQVRVGTRATVVPELPGGRYPATVTVTDAVFDSASGTFGARLDLPNPQGTLPAGIRCKVEFAVEGRGAVTGARAPRP